MEPPDVYQELSFHACQLNKNPTKPHKKNINLPLNEFIGKKNLQVSQPERHVQTKLVF